MRPSFPVVSDDAAVERLLAQSRKPNGPVCPHCNSCNVQTGAKHVSQSYRRRAYRKRFSVRTETVVSKSKLGLRTWIHIWHDLANRPKGLPSSLPRISASAERRQRPNPDSMPKG